MANPLSVLHITKNENNAICLVKLTVQAAVHSSCVRRGQRGSRLGGEARE